MKPDVKQRNQAPTADGSVDSNFTEAALIQLRSESLIGGRQCEDLRFSFQEQPQWEKLYSIEI